MLTPTLRDDMTIQLDAYLGGDVDIARAAMVSTKGADVFQAELEDGKLAGLIEFLMKGRHGTPFEHNSMRFRVEAPIFVFREWHRHRIGWSYNEESARYKQMAPTFWMPSKDRPLVQKGKPGHYVFEKGTQSQQSDTKINLEVAYEESYKCYERMLKANIAREVARACLPVGTYSSMYATCNARSLMAFLSLRTKDDTAHFKSFPQAEIEQCARLMEAEFSKLFPITHQMFLKYGRVSP